MFSMRSTVAELPYYGQALFHAYSLRVSGKEQPRYLDYCYGLRYCYVMENSPAVTIEMIPASQIVAGDNDRKAFGPQALAELAASIDANGLAQPPTVRPLASGLYEVVAGERRFRAVTTILGWTEVPVIVRSLDDEAAGAIMLAENVARANLNPIEEAVAYQRRMARFGFSQADLAAQVGVPRQTVYRRLQLLKLRPEMIDLVASGQLDQAFATAMVDFDADRQIVAWKALGAGLNLSEFRAVCARLEGEQAQESMFDPSTFWSIEDYVTTGREAPKRSEKEQLRAMVRRLADQVAQSDPQLAAEAVALADRRAVSA